MTSAGYAAGPVDGDCTARPACAKEILWALYVQDSLARPGGRDSRALRGKHGPVLKRGFYRHRRAEGQLLTACPEITRRISPSSSGGVIRLLVWQSGRAYNLQLCCGVPGRTPDAEMSFESARTAEG
jgi:hypothetical protein